MSVARVVVGTHLVRDVAGGLVLGVTMTLVASLAVLPEANGVVRDRSLAAPAR